MPSRRRSAASRPPASAGPGPSPAAPAAGFYAGALDASQREALLAALQVEGLDLEIALLRLKLQQLLEDGDLPSILRTIELLIRGVTARYRTGGRNEAALYDSIVGVLKSVHEVMAMPDD